MGIQEYDFVGNIILGITVALLPRICCKQHHAIIVSRLLAIFLLFGLGDLYAACAIDFNQR